MTLKLPAQVHLQFLATFQLQLQHVLQVLLLLVFLLALLLPTAAPAEHHVTVDPVPLC
jgi:hypothetical protein